MTGKAPQQPNEAALWQALERAGVSVPPDEIRAIIAGIAAVPGLVDGEAWIELVAPGADPETCALLGDYVRHIRLSAKDGLGASPAPAVRLESLRVELTRRGLDGFVVPLADEYQGEFIPRRAQRLAWLTGFAGSAGLAVVLPKKAAIFVDGRYTLQVRGQVDVAAFEPLHVGDSPPHDWVAENMTAGQKLGFDPWLHTVEQCERLRAACTRAGAELVPVDTNPIDTVWECQPPAPISPVTVHAAQFAGQDAGEKRAQIAATLDRAKASAVVLTAPDSIAWLLNIRGGDVANTPLPLGFAILHRDETVELFIDPRKLTSDVRAHLGNGVSIAEPGRLGASLDALAKGGKRVQLDPSGAPSWIVDRLAMAGAELIRAADPCLMPKACKNAVELDGSRRAHVRDGAAVADFLCWLEREAPQGGVTEMSAVERLYAFRRDSENFRGGSFDTISGAGPDGAIVHYRVEESTDRALQPGDVYLVDSGAQYLDGTTDITRTVYVRPADGAPAGADPRDRYTRVLKGHIALAMACFPVGTTGTQLDILARQALWSAGLDYDHGTGHGVGSFLGVHEGPARISKAGSTIALRPGMILSNEPGYYKEGAYGIRIENLVAVRATRIPGGEREMLEFETLTVAPIDRALIEPALLTAEEAAWLDVYHARVREALAPLVRPETRDWLAAATAPL